jgi:hypothetical protein
MKDLAFPETVPNSVCHFKGSPLILAHAAGSVIAGATIGVFPASLPFSIQHVPDGHATPL